MPRETLLPIAAVRSSMQCVNSTAGSTVAAGAAAARAVVAASEMRKRRMIEGSGARVTTRGGPERAEKIPKNIEHNTSFQTSKLS